MSYLDPTYVDHEVRVYLGAGEDPPDDWPKAAADLVRASAGDMLEVGA